MKRLCHTAEKCGELEIEVRELQVVNVWESHLAQRLPTRSCNRYSRTCRAEMIRLITECHEEAVPPQAALLTETLVGVAMGTFG